MNKSISDPSLQSSLISGLHLVIENSARFDLIDEVSLSKIKLSPYSNFGQRTVKPLHDSYNSSEAS